MRRLFAFSAIAAAAMCAIPLSATAQTSFAATPLGAPAQPAAPAPDALSEAVVLSVNDEMISSYDIVQRMRLLIVTAGIQPSDQDLPELQREAVRSLVDEHLELQSLRHEEKEQKFDLIANDAEVDDYIGDIARSANTSPDKLIANLNAQGVATQTFRDQLKAELSWQDWIRGRYGQHLAIGDDQVKAFEKRQEAEAGKPHYHLAEIFIDAGRAGGMAAAEQGAAQLENELQKGAPFAGVARQFSNTPSAANGGDVGWIAAGEMPPEVDQALENLRPGQPSPPIEVKDGVYIVLVHDRRSGGASLVLKLKQLAIALPKTATPDDVTAAEAKLNEARGKMQGCENIEAVAAKMPGVVAGDLGEMEDKDLAPAFKSVVDGLPAGQVSAPVRTDVGVHIIAVCDRHSGSTNQLTREQIENRLMGEELAMISKRQLRDLRNSATIETR